MAAWSLKQRVELDLVGIVTDLVMVWMLEQAFIPISLSF